MKPSDPPNAVPPAPASSRTTRWLRRTGLALIAMMVVALPLIPVYRMTGMVFLMWIAAGLALTMLVVAPVYLLVVFVHTALYRVSATLQEVWGILIASTAPACLNFYLLKQNGRLENGMDVGGAIIVSLTTFAGVCAMSLWGLSVAKHRRLTDASARLKCLAAGWLLAMVLTVPLILVFCYGR
ncbi:MAG: hypothetical protein KIS92_03770 [Planctomycetota bacterium]|nr:hypothetical protein [Planctomycetota bacterium]